MKSTDLETALKASPENVPLRKMLLSVLMDELKYEKVFQISREGLKYDASNSDYKLYMAKGAYYIGKVNVAQVILEELFEAGEDSSDLYLWMGKCFFAQGNKTEAGISYKKALKLDPEVQDEELDSLLKIAVSSNDSGKNDNLVDIECPDITFKDVGGMENVKKDIQMKIILPLKQPEVFEAYGKKAGGGILLFGPPGCGKTYIARAAAGEAEAGFIAVGIHEIFTMWLGESEKNMNRLFMQARRNKPCILFFDEVDALGTQRMHIRGDAGKNVVNQFLAEMDGVQQSNEGVLIIGATNAPWDVDSAFRRPGRFDKIVFVPPPDKNARKEILQLLILNRPFGTINVEEIAAKTVDFSGADLKGLIDQVIEDKLEKSVESGKVELITQSDILQKLKTIKPSTLEWFATAKNYATYSNDGGQFDPILDYLKSKR